MRYARKTSDEQRSKLMMHVEIHGSDTALKRCKDVLQDLDFAEIVIDHQQKEIERLRAENERLLNAMKVASSMAGKDWLESKLMLADVISGEECPIRYADMFSKETTHERS